MRIVIVGGGPAGLYFAILMKRLDPAHEIVVLERDGPNDTFGWGIVFSDQTFGYLRDSDQPSFERLVAACQRWDTVDIVHPGATVSVGGNRFSGIARLVFLKTLHARCLELGVDLRFHAPVTDLGAVPPHDLLVGADGANSVVRRVHEGAFQPAVELGANKYIWLGTPRLFHGLTLTFRKTADGVFAAHSYKFDATRSTFIVECSEATWKKAGFAWMSEGEMCRALERIFAADLEGHPVLTNNFVRWINFPLVRNRRWHDGATVLLGDALHTAHFSIGSGTKLALEDAISLASAIRAADGRIGPALAAFERDRKPIVDAYQDSALESQRWFETMEGYVSLDPLPFAYALMTRSRKITREKLRVRDPGFVESYERYLAAQAPSG
jgi:anthraniloyl-CoA monooxygenase